MNASSCSSLPNIAQGQWLPSVCGQLQIPAGTSCLPRCESGLQLNLQQSWHCTQDGSFIALIYPQCQEKTFAASPSSNDPALGWLVLVLVISIVFTTILILVINCRIYIKLKTNYASVTALSSEAQNGPSMYETTVPGSRGFRSPQYDQFTPRNVGTDPMTQDYLDGDETSFTRDVQHLTKTPQINVPGSYPPQAPCSPTYTVRSADYVSGDASQLNDYEHVNRHSSTRPLDHVRPLETRPVGRNPSQTQEEKVITDTNRFVCLSEPNCQSSRKQLSPGGTSFLVHCCKHGLSKYPLFNEDCLQYGNSGDKASSGISNNASRRKSLFENHTHQNIRGRQQIQPHATERGLAALCESSYLPLENNRRNKMAGVSHPFADRTSRPYSIGGDHVNEQHQTLDNLIGQEGIMQSGNVQDKRDKMYTAGVKTRSHPSLRGDRPISCSSNTTAIGGAVYCRVPGVQP